MLNNVFIFSLVASLIFSCTTQTNDTQSDKISNADKYKISDTNPLLYANESNFSNIQQLTNGGDNAETYFSFDSKKLIFQKSHPEGGIECDQIFIGDVPAPGEKFEYEMVSTGKGRTTCAYFMPGDTTFIYASTHTFDEACPEVPDRNEIGQYVWPVYSSFEIFIADLDGNIINQVTDNYHYDAEATVSPNGDKIVFTSTRSGDLELWTMDIDGSNQQQITDGLGYDGGAFFTPNGKELIFRASRPQTPEAIANYQDLLARGMVAPSDMELYMCNIDGSNLRKITDLGNANWAPFMHPSGEKIIFSSNHEAKQGFPFNLYMINIDGTDVTQITYDKKFDAFPMFSPDGKKIVFSSNRQNGGTRDTNVFLADWND